jgi:hypothetical protein
MRAFIRKAESFYDGFTGTVELTITARLSGQDQDPSDLLSGNGEVEITRARDASVLPAAPASVPLPVKTEELYRVGRRVLFPRKA